MFTLLDVLFVFKIGQLHQTHCSVISSFKTSLLSQQNQIGQNNNIQCRAFVRLLLVHIFGRLRVLLRRLPAQADRLLPPNVRHCEQPPSLRLQKLQKS